MIGGMGMKEIFAQLLERLLAGGDAVLVTLTPDTGRGPRGAGVQMLVGSAGRIAGTVGGGETERAMTALAVQMLKERRGGMQAHASGGESGTACGGATAYFQYVKSGDPHWTALAARLLAHLEQGGRGWLILRLDGGEPVLLGEDRAPLSGEAPADCAPLCGDACVMRGGCLAVPLRPGERAVIFGAGHCARALAPLLASVGFRVTVFDDREALADAALFPQAERVICGALERIADRLTLTRDDYVVSMTSTHASDLCVMRQVLAAERAYVGMLGGQGKRAFVAGKLREAGIPQARIDGMRTPVGLDIRAVTPEEIAVSIAAEMVLVRAQNRERAGKEKPCTF